MTYCAIVSQIDAIAPYAVDASMAKVRSHLSRRRRGFRVAGYSINGSVHFICVDWSHIGETLLVGKAVSNNKLLTLLIAMRSDVLDSWVVVKGGFLNAHPSQ